MQSQTAFLRLERHDALAGRVTSEIELYGPDPDRALVSRFALNVPEFQSVIQTGTPPGWARAAAWEAFAEVSPFGAEERQMLHAERGICDAAGHFAGAVVVHIVPRLPRRCRSSRRPIRTTKCSAAPAALPPASRIADLQVVVYGWSLQPIFTSGRIAWPHLRTTSSTRL